MDSHQTTVLLISATSMEVASTKMLIMVYSMRGHNNDYHHHLQFWPRFLFLTAG